MTDNSDQRKIDAAKMQEDNLKKFYANTGKSESWWKKRTKNLEEKIAKEKVRNEKFKSNMLGAYLIAGAIGLVVLLGVQIVSCNPGKRIKYFTPFGPVIENPNR